MSRPFPSRSAPPASFVRINGKIRAREVRVIGHDGNQLGVMPLTDAINLARQQGVDLVEIAATANPPVCRIVEFGKYRYDLAKKEKESKKHQHANKIKEVQLSPKIDPHDLGVKVDHAIGFLSEDMKVKVTLKFRGREMAHKEYGFQVVKKFLESIALYGHPDFEPKLIGRGINVMITPLPRNKRPKSPRREDEGEDIHTAPEAEQIKKPKPDIIASKQPPAAFGNNAFNKLDLNVRQDSPPSAQG